MPKVPKLRPNYLADARFLFRLAHAIQTDLSRPKRWRVRATQQVQDLAHFLMTDGQTKKTSETEDSQEADEGETCQES